MFCQGWGVPPQGSHSPPPFRPRFSAPHPFHVFFFFFLLFGYFVLEGFLVWCFELSPHPTLVFHLFLLVLFWTSVPFSVLD